MNDRMPSDGLLLALLAEGREEGTRWLARLLEDAGYAVLRERTGRHARERARVAQPDLIVIAADLPDMAGTELCHALRADARITSGTPILLALPESPTREQRLAALRAGAWECITPPHDPEEILLKAHTYVRAKRDADRTRLEGLLDPQTGLYNRQGLARHARELGSQAFREHGPLACVVLAFDFAMGGAALADEVAEAAVARGVQLLLSSARRSDVIGQLAPGEFAVLAPGTDVLGAKRLAERLAGSLEAGVTDSPTPVLVRCGYEAVGNVGYAPIEPVELLVRAASALRNGQAEGGGRIRRSTPVPSAAPAASK